VRKKEREAMRKKDGGTESEKEGKRGNVKERKWERK
jgi:hypothetical protein